MKIGVDIDGVIADSLNTWVRELNRHFAQDKKLEDIVFYQFEKIYNVSWEEMDRFFRTNQELLLTNLAPVEQAAEILRRLKDDHDLMLITARPEQYRYLTEKWLREHGIVYDNLVMTNFGDKSCHCKSMDIEIFIEDSLENALSIYQAGIPVILFDAPYNQGPLPKGMLRKKNWQEIYQALINRERKMFPVFPSGRNLVFQEE